jgi:hypothetical protein
VLSGTTLLVLLLLDPKKRHPEEADKVDENEAG